MKQINDTTRHAARVRLVSDAVVASYVHELSPHVHRAPRAAGVRRLRQPVAGRAGMSNRPQSPDAALRPAAMALTP
jgi:hypothetical protein